MEANEGSQTLNSSLPATETGEIGGLVGSDRPNNADDTLNASTVDTDNDAGTPSGADDKGAASDDKGKPPAEEDTTGEADKGGTDKGDEETRFDQHPRFQQLRVERDKERIARERLEAQMEILTKVVEPPPKPAKAEELPYKDTSNMPEDELAQWQANDPKGYEANLEAKITHNLLKNLSQNAETHSRQDAINKEYASHAAEFPDFNERWKTGEIKKFIDAHPGHTPMSAHLRFVVNDMKTQHAKEIEEAVTKAKTDTEKEVLARIASKQKAHVLGGGPAASIQVPGSDATELNDTKQHGGLKAGLANLLHTMRQGAGA
jgi:hypothetical protein